MPDGTIYVTQPDGTSYAEYPDGTVRVEYTDGTIKQQNPDGEVVQMNPDGTFGVKAPGKDIMKIYNEDGKLIGATGNRSNGWRRQCKCKRHRSRRQL